ncbi:MAG: substrate-binding domain-containing protein [Trebonia sp.]
MSEAMRRRVRRSRRARIGASVAAVSTAAVLIASGSSASAHSTARASASLLPATVHPPTFNDAKLFGIRNALSKAMKGKNVKSVNTWMVVNILATYWVAGKDGNAAAAKELGVAAHFEGPSQGQLSTQVSEYNTLAASGANGMFTSVIDPVSEGSTINKAESKGVNVVAIDSPVPAKNAKTFVYVGTPNTAAGEAAGEAMKKALPGGGDVAILEGSSTATNSLQRIAGFKAALKGSKITVKTVQNDNGSAATAASNADSVIAGNPSLKGIYGVYSYDGPAASVAVKAKGDTGKIHVVADDTEPGTITGLQNGTVSASIIQQPFMQGYLGTYITTAMKVLGKSKTASLIKPFETGGQISTGVGTLTKANLKQDVTYNKTISAY